MGILKDKEEKRKEKIPEGYKFKNKNNEKVLVYDFKYQEEKSNLVTAKIRIGNSNEFNICFSIPENMSIMNIVKLGLVEALDKVDKFDNLKEGYNYLGGIVRKTNSENKSEQFLLTKALDEKKYVDEKMNMEFKKQQGTKAKDEFRKKLQEQTKNNTEPKSKEQLQQEFDEKIKQQSNVLPKEILEERQLRKENPKIELKEVYVNNNIYDGKPELYAYYEGTDITTGEVIRLNETSCKVVDNKYIYTTFISHADKEGQKPSISEMPFGNPAIFELPFELEKVVCDKEMNKIMPVLELISKSPEMLLEKDKMKFLGTVENGKAKRNVISDKNIKTIIIKEIYKYQEMMKRNKQAEKE